MLAKLLLNLYLWPAFILVTVASLIVLPFLLAGNLLITRLPARSCMRRLIRVYGWVMTRLLPFMAPVAVDYRGGMLPAEPVIFVANHFSAVDPYLFGLLPRENAFVTSWPFRIPVYSLAMRAAGYIDARMGWEEVQRRAEGLLRAGSSLVIWPEGHRSRNGRLGRLRKGAFELACRTNTMIVPVCIIGTDRLLPPGQRWFTPARIRMSILPAISPAVAAHAPDPPRFLKEHVRATLAGELLRQGVDPTRQRAPVHGGGLTPLAGPSAHTCSKRGTAG